jgi:hypothetical protein
MLWPLFVEQTAPCLLVKSASLKYPQAPPLFHPRNTTQDQKLARSKPMRLDARKDLPRKIPMSYALPRGSLWIISTKKQLGGWWLVLSIYVSTYLSIYLHIYSFISKSTNHGNLGHR